MDESSLETLNSMNIEESCVSRRVQGALSGQKKVENLEGDGLYFYGLQTLEALAHRRKILSHQFLDKLRPKQTTQGLQLQAPFTRRNTTRKEITLDRECKKLEKVWSNRGLPVDKESLQSAASKDAFDLRSLSESLPSTSASEKKTNFLIFRKSWKERQRLFSPIIRERIERLKDSSFAPEEKRFVTDDRLPEPELTTAVCSSTISYMKFKQRGKERWLRAQCKAELQSHEKISTNTTGRCARSDTELRLSLMCRQRHLFHNEVIPSELDKESAFYPQRETNKEIKNSKVDEISHCLAHARFTVPVVNLGESEQDSTVFNSQEKCESAPLLNLSRIWNSRNADTGRCDSGINLDTDDNDKFPDNPVPFNSPNKDDGSQSSSWNSRRYWNTNIQFSGASMPHNSPYKKEDISTVSLLAKVIRKAYSEQLKMKREESKLRMLNSHRDVSGEMDAGPEIEKPLPNQTARVSLQKLLDSRKEADDFESCLSQLRRCKLTDMKVSVKSIRCFQSPFPRCFMKYNSKAPE